MLDGALLPSLHAGDGVAQHLEPGAGANALARQDAPIGPRAGPAGEQAMEMPGIVMQALAALKPSRDHRHEGFDRLERVGDRRFFAEQRRVDADQELRASDRRRARS